MDRYESMGLLVAAVEAGSFSAAARKLGVPLPTLSRKVAELEAHLGTRLLHRSSRKLTLTEVGRSYLAACQRILHDLDEAERAAKGEYRAPRGQLVLTAPIVFGRLHVLPVLTDFLEAYPEIDARLLLSDRSVSLLEEHVDVAIRIGELPDSSLLSARLGAIRRVVCASPEYLAKHGAPKAPAELREHACITFEGVAAAERWVFRGAKGNVSRTVRSRLVVNTAEAAIDAATRGLGLTCVLSYQVAAAERAQRLERVLREFEPDPVPVHVVYLPQAPLALKLRAFLDFATPRLKAVLRRESVETHARTATLAR
jgi:DNA-binding transcriptional LysR family regulator